MTPETLAAVQDRAYVHMRPWRARDFQAALARPTTKLVTHRSSFLLAQVIPDAAELLTIFPAPDAQRQGQGRRLMQEFESQMTRLKVTRLLLDVAAINTSAVAFYTALGFTQDGNRRQYYTLRDGKRSDAILMSKTLTPE